MKIFVSHRSEILIFDNYIRHQNLKNELIDVLENYQDTQSKSTNVKATMTEWNVSSPEIENLKKYILTKSQSFLWPSSKPKIENFWANIYRKGEYAEYHDHNPYGISFVYFLKCEKYFSPLTFKCFWFNKKINPKEGRVVIFPSYLMHGVPVHKYDEKRITLSGNINF